MEAARVRPVASDIADALGPSRTYVCPQVSASLVAPGPSALARKRTRRTGVLQLYSEDDTVYLRTKRAGA
ncbi:hypothetical protein VULLAG_LOCUS6136 [Vulpes lagopus]